MATGKYTPDKMRAEFAEVLRAYARRIDTAADDLQKSYEDGKVPLPWLPLNAGGKTKGASAALRQLGRFIKKEIEGKLEDVKAGDFRYRESELQIGKKTGSDKAD